MNGKGDEENDETAGLRDGQTLLPVTPVRSRVGGREMG